MADLDMFICCLGLFQISIYSEFPNGHTMCWKYWHCLINLYQMCISFEFKTLNFSIYINKLTKPEAQTLQNIAKFFCKNHIHIHGCAWIGTLLVFKPSQIAKFMRPTWGPPGSYRAQVSPMLAPWTTLSGLSLYSKERMLMNWKAGRVV